MADKEKHYVHVAARDAGGNLVFHGNVYAIDGKIDIPELRGEKGPEPAQMGFPVAGAYPEGKAPAITPTMARLLGKE